MIIDFHVHLGRDLDGEQADFENLKEVMERNSIAKAVVFAFNCPDMLEQSEKILQISKSDDTIIPFLRFDPKTITPEELENALRSGYKGVKLHPTSQSFFPDDAQYRWIFDRLHDYRLPILFHTNTSITEPFAQPERVLELAKLYPDQIFILGHAAGAETVTYAEINKHSNVYVETSVDAYMVHLKKVFQRYGFRRILFGSDFPYSLPHIEMEKIRCASIPDDLKEDIFYRNAQRILNGSGVQRI